MIEIRRGVYAYEQFQLKADLQVAKGSFTAVLGPSGAGKSTLLSVIAGFEPLTSGTLRIDGADHTRSHPSTRPLSMVFQDNNSFAHLDAWANVALGISPKLRLSEDEQERVDLALKRTGLGSLSHRKPGEMSGGERQRIALARMLVRDKPVMLLDEPFTALSPALRSEMVALVRALHDERKLTTLMVTHDPEDAKQVADQVIYVGDGVVRAPVETRAFFATKDEAVKTYLG